MMNSRATLTKKMTWEELQARLLIVKVGGLLQLATRKEGGGLPIEPSVEHLKELDNGDAADKNASTSTCSHKKRPLHGERPFV